MTKVWLLGAWASALVLVSVSSWAGETGESGNVPGVEYLDRVYVHGFRAPEPVKYIDSPTREIPSGSATLNLQRNYEKPGEKKPGADNVDIKDPCGNAIGKAPVIYATGEKLLQQTDFSSQTCEIHFGAGSQSGLDGEQLVVMLD